MKKMILFFVTALIVFPICFAVAQSQSSICGKCSWYAREGNVRGYFEDVFLNLEEDLRSGPIDKKSGKRISQYNLDELLVKVSAHLSCAEKNCSDHPQLVLFRKYVHAIKKNITSGRICSPE
ncbi:MAG: hypothetical protein V1690_00795 [Candidatus Moraniibacteriota bacterium]